MAKIYLKDVQEELEPLGWKVISTEYKSLDTEMSFECPEGHQVVSTWKRLRGKHECPICKSNQQVINETEV